MTFVGQFYQKNEHFIPKEVFVPQNVDAAPLEALLETKVLQPQRGDKRNWSIWPIKCPHCLGTKFALIERTEERTIGVVDRLGEAMGIPTPYRIEAFDNSHIMGTDPVSAMVVLSTGSRLKMIIGNIRFVPHKAATIMALCKKSSTADTRVLKENLPFPDLIIIDGGKAQVGAAQEVLHNQLGLDIPVAGLVKNNKHKTSELIFGEF